MNELQSEDPQRGKLIWRGFYGPPRNILGWGNSEIRLLIMMFVGFPLMGAVILFGVRPDIFQQRVWYALLVGLTIPAILFILRLIVVNIIKKNHFDLVRGGKFDWDLHQNGILTTFRRDGQTECRERRFLPFGAISHVHLVLQDNDMERILEKMRERDKNDPGYNPLDYILTKPMERAMRDSIWLESTDGYLIYELDREWLRDVGRFEAIIREKVKAVD